MSTTRGFEIGEFLGSQWSRNGAPLVDLKFCPNEEAITQLDALFERQPQRWLRVHNQEVADLAFLSELPHLRCLELYGPDPGTRLPPVTATAVRYVVHKCDLETLASMSELESATIDCDLTADLAPLRTLSKLRSLTVLSKRLTKCKGLDGMALRSVAIPGASSGLEVLRTMPDLQTLEVEVPKKGMAALGELAGVQTLRLIATKGAVLEGMHRFPALVRLRVDGEFVDHAPLSELTQLVSLEVGRHKTVAHLGWLGDKPELQSLRVFGLRALESIDGVQSLPSLRTFGMAGRYRDVDLAPLLSCPKLRKVSLRVEGMTRRIDEGTKALRKRSIRVDSTWRDRDVLPLAWREPLV